MPISSAQVNSMIGGQQAMFGNFASYSHQIGPGGGGGQGMPTYPNPMRGAGSAFKPPPPPNFTEQSAVMNMGPKVMSGGMSALGTASSAAIMGGMFLPGRMGRAFGAMDPFTAGLGGFARGAGLRQGGAGIMANMGRVASGGIGSIARAGIGGLAGGMVAAAPVYAAYKAASFAGGQMVQGAQFQNQVQGVLRNQFRHVNPESQTGFGFSREQGAGISDMIRTMGHKDMMTSPQELLNVMKQGAGMGVFKAVQDAKEFKKRFKDMIGAVKEVAKTMHTTLEGAMPFMAESKRQGFWTPQDIQRSASMAQRTASTTGMSVAQTQQMMGQGAQMARRIGADGMTGAIGMTKSMNLVAGALRGGTFNERQMAEATGGLQGPQAIQAMAGTMQAATTRFAGSRRARWLLAAAGRDGFKRLDTGMLREMAAGGVGLGEIGRRARSNIKKQGAYNFVMNEQNLRGELTRMGPEAQSGFVKAIAGKHLYGGTQKSQLVTRKLMKRYFGVGGKQADMMAKMARDMPRIMEENESRHAAGLDQTERNREELMNRSYEGFKRKGAQWFDKLKEPFQEMGARINKGIGDWWQKATDKFWGRAPAGSRLRGLTSDMVQSLQRGALGDTQTVDRKFATGKEMSRMLGGSQAGTIGSLGTTGQFARGFAGQKGFWAGASNQLMMDPRERGLTGKALTSISGAASRLFGGGYDENKKLAGQQLDSAQNWLRKQGTLGAIGAGAMGMLGLGKGGGDVTNEQIENLRKAGVAEHAFRSEADRTQAMGRGDLLRGAIRGGVTHAYRAMSKKDVETAGKRIQAAQGRITKETAQALGFKTKDQATKSLSSARKAMQGSNYILQALQQRDAARQAEGDEFSAIGLARRQVREIRSGRMKVDESIKTLVQEGGIDQAAFRLASAMPKRQQRAMGMDVAGELGGEEVRVSRMGGREAARKVFDKQSNVAWRLAHYVMKAQKGPTDVTKEGSQKAIMKLMQAGGKEGGQFRQAMTLMRSGKPADQRRARDIFSRMAGESEDPNVQETLRTLASDGPDSKNLANAMKTMGDWEAVRGTLVTKEVIGRRMGRLQDSMGENQEMILSAMDRMSGKADGDVRIGQEVRQMLLGDDSPEGFKERLQRIATGAREADPRDVGRMLSGLEGVEGAETIKAALRGGATAGRLVKQLKKGKTGAGQMREILAGAGVEGERVTEASLKALKGPGGEEAKKKILEGVDPKSREGQWASEMLDMMKDPGGNITRIQTAATESATARAIGTLASPDKNLAARARDRRNAAAVGDVVGGRLGSSTAQHSTLLRMETILASIRDKAGATAIVGNPAEAPDGPVAPSSPQLGPTR